MEVANTLAYYNVATITTIKIFIVQAPLERNKAKNGIKREGVWDRKNVNREKSFESRNCGKLIRQVWIILFLKLFWK